MFGEIADTCFIWVLCLWPNSRYFFVWVICLTILFGRFVFQVLAGGICYDRFCHERGRRRGGNAPYVLL